ncbi:hypothetical protein ACFQ0E_16285 [Lysobacter brunescens]|uniref:HEAT repeat domain-containing protein n=2 Tax=Lysobacter brunescens TaxID=262323 RepID=A0ABW2YF75_9GAMM
MNPHPFTQRIALLLEHGDAECLRHALIDAAEMLRIWRRFGGDPGRAKGIVGPFSTDEAFPPMGSADRDLLRQALCSVLERWRDADIVSSAANALMNLAEPEARPVLVQALRHAVAADNRAVFQLLLALEAIDEDIYDAGLTTRSYDADEINRAAALRYLQRIDSNAPAG